MPLTAVPPIDLSVLEDVIQQRLQAALPEISPLQASCTLKQQTLLMVVQHPLPELSHPIRVFRVLETLFQEEKLDQRFRGLMYLQVQGQGQPYAFHNFISAPPADDVAAQVRATTPEGLHERGEILTPQPDVSATTVSRLVPPPPPPNPRLTEIDEQLEPITVQNDGEETLDFLNAEDRDEFVDAGEFLEPTEQPDGRLTQWWSQWGDRVGLAIIALGSVLGVGVFLGSLYAMSRPCVLLGCESLDVAQELANRSISTLQDPPSGKAVLQAQGQLDQSIDLLEKIPSWSRRHGEAQNLITTYEATAANASELVNALQAANQAAQLTQNPPLPLETWQASVAQWEVAIAGLDAIPPTSEFYRFARKKIQEYRQNLAIIEQRFEQEQEATESLAAAQEAAKIAQVREDIAQSAADLQLAYSTWQTAVNALQEIPASSILSEEAQRLLKTYQPKANLARDRQTFENFAKDTYAQAIQFADQAKISQQQNQWSQAVGHWRKAVSALKQIPKSSFNYVKAQPLLDEYQAALGRAESRQSGAIQLQDARSEIEKLCTSENPRVCLFTLNREKITIHLSGNYIERVRKGNVAAQNQGNLAVQVNIREHIAQLEQALEKISDRTGVPLEIYTHENILVKSHDPR